MLTGRVVICMQNNPYIIKGDINTSRWSIYHREGFLKIATFSNQIAAYDARRALIKFKENQI